MINDLYFNDITIENEFRGLLARRFAADDVYNLYSREINLVTMDIDEKEDVQLPAVTFYIYQNNTINPDDEQINRYTSFTAEINVYTSGDSKVLKNRQLCNIIIEILQSNGLLSTYYNRGLKLEENTEVNTMLENAYRRTIRMSGICDNETKLIKRGD